MASEQRSLLATPPPNLHPTTANSATVHLVHAKDKGDILDSSCISIQPVLSALALDTARAHHSLSFYPSALLWPLHRLLGITPRPVSHITPHPLVKTLSGTPFHGEQNPSTLPCPQRPPSSAHCTHLSSLPSSVSPGSPSRHPGPPSPSTRLGSFLSHQLLSSFSSLWFLKSTNPSKLMQTPQTSL
jgi:hypothetical protein